MHRTLARRAALLPWAAAVTLAVIGVAEILLDSAFSAAPAVPAAALATVVAGTALAGRFPIAGSAVVAAAFPVAVAGGLNGPTGAAVLGFFLAPGWAGYQRAASWPPATSRPSRFWSAGSRPARFAFWSAGSRPARFAFWSAGSRPARFAFWSVGSWPAPLAAQLMASLGTWIAGRAAGSTVGGLAAMAWENLFFGLLCWGAWGVGLLARRLQDRAELLARLTTALDAERDAREHAIVAEERQRIARDMHDAVAHSISVMVLQLGAVRATLPAGTPQAEMLQGVERLGRESVRELHTLVGILRDTPDLLVAQPSIARAEELVAQLRAAGLPVELTVDGDLTGVPRAQDISAYRVLQEALTNVLRHAGTAATSVHLHRATDRLTLTVDNVLPSTAPEPATAPDGGGHGLIGMRERIAVFSGTLTAGARPGGFTVRASFPLGTAS
ncbi:sensor histidine kinase [Dactylosporangium sp. NPDC050588]|uniref:sensor histidine kinase n=1 Tax=Dactylosporangium sp. NPDC050588 TaxID=3157211 RepID=UPI0033F81A12